MEFTSFRNDYIELKPVNYDWSVGYTENWNLVYPDFSEYELSDLERVAECYGIDLDDYETDDENFDKEDLIEAINEHFQENPHDLEPMMNYYYPLTHDIEPDKLQALILDKASGLVVIEVNDSYALVLKAGGMDMSWEIVQAFVLMGFLPPAHFAELKQQAGRGDSDEDKRLIKACMRSLKIAMDWNRYALERLAKTYDEEDELAKLLK
jgi:hypothetical protein